MDEQEVRDRMRERFDCTNAEFDGLLRFISGSGHNVPACRNMALVKLTRAARGERGDGTFVALVQAWLDGARLIVARLGCDGSLGDCGASTHEEYVKGECAKCQGRTE